MSELEESFIYFEIHLLHTNGRAVTVKGERSKEKIEDFLMTTGRYGHR